MSDALAGRRKSLLPTRGVRARVLAERRPFRHRRPCRAAGSRRRGRRAGSPDRRRVGASDSRRSASASSRNAIRFGPARSRTSSSSTKRGTTCSLRSGGFHQGWVVVNAQIAREEDDARFGYRCVLMRGRRTRSVTRSASATASPARASTPSSSTSTSAAPAPPSATRCARRALGAVRSDCRIGSAVTAVRTTRSWLERSRRVLDRLERRVARRSRRSASRGTRSASPNAIRPELVLLPGSTPAAPCGPRP